MLELRAITDDEIRAYREAVFSTFGDDAQDADPDGDGRVRALLPAGSAWAVYDGAQIVGTAGSFDLEIGMPGGGTLPCAGLTMVTVRPTHRRRGVLRQMMERYVARAREREQPIGGLWASEATIYGRFGFSVAAWGDAITVTGANRLAIAGGGDAISMIDEAAAREVLPSIYARAIAGRPGALHRSEAWWRERRFLEAPYMRKGSSRRRHVLATRGTEHVGYVQYRVRSGFTNGLPSGTVDIVELHGIDTRAVASLWSYLCSIDLFPTVSWGNAPVDEPLVHLASDVRRIARSRADTLWLWIDDVSRALAARTWSGELRVAIGDEVYELPSGVRATGKPHVTIAKPALPTLLLGAARPSELARAGLVTGDIGLADRVFASSPAPWCPELF